MKLISLLLLIVLAPSCSSSRFPDKMPADFKIVYHLDGGMRNEHRNITLQMGECKDEGREDEVDYAYSFTITDIKELETLYSSLKKLNAFSLKSKNGGEVYDRGGESIRYTINKKEYEVSNNQNMFINKSDAEEFNSSIDLIMQFVESHRKPELINRDNPQDSSSTIIEKTDSTRIIEVNKSGIPATMPIDFKIQYNMSGGITDEYRIIVLQLNTCKDEGHKDGEPDNKLSWKSKDKIGMEKLYKELYQLNAFTLKYTEKGKVYDRGGEKLRFIINGKEYIVNNSGNAFIDPNDQAAFKKAVNLILAYTDKNHPK